MTQKQIILKKLKEEGSVSNLWAIQAGIWRLGAIINVLREEGFEIETDYQPSKTKVTTYRFKSKPKVIYKVEGRPELLIKTY